jgi:hypothetical protein
MADLFPVRTGLDSLGHQAEAEGAGQGNSGPDNGLVARAIRQAGHEAAVQLQLSDGEVAQAAQAAVPGPVVVHGEPDAEVLQLCHHATGSFGVDHDGVLGDLEHQGRGPEPMGPEQPGDRPGAGRAGWPGGRSRPGVPSRPPGGAVCM